MGIIVTFLANAGLNFALGLLVAKFLGPDEFGRFAIANAVAIFINTAIFDWIRLAGARHYTEAVREREPAIRATLEALYFGTMAAVLAVVGIGALSGIDFGLPNTMLGAAVIAAIGNALFDYHSTLARGRFLDRTYASLVLVKNLAAFALMAGGAWWFGSATIVFIGLAASVLGSVALFRPALADRDTGLKVATRAQALAFLRYGVPLVVANALYVITLLINRSLIATEYGFAEAGRFSLAYDVGVRVIAVVGSALDIVLFAVAVRADATQGRAEAERQVAKNIVTVMAVLLPAALGYWLILPGFQALLVPQAFRGSFEAYSAVLIPVVLIFCSMNYIVNPVFQIARRTAPVVIAAAAALAANLVAVLVLPRTLGPIGYAYATLFAYCVAAIVAVAMAVRSMNVRPSARDIGLILLASAVMTALLYPLRGMQPAALAAPLIAALGLAIYGGIIALFDVGGLRTRLTELIAGRGAARPGAVDVGPGLSGV